jgi:hypothetical protein
VHHGAVALLVMMSRTKNRDARLDVSRGLSLLCSLEDNHETVFRQGGFQALIDFITKVRDEHDMQAVLYKGDSVVSTYAALAVRFLIMQPNVSTIVQCKLCLSNYYSDFSLAHCIVGAGPIFRSSGRTGGVLYSNGECPPQRS